MRWFHPSDEAQQIDWNKLAVYGVKEVEGARSTNELKIKLLDIFSPITPGLELFDGDENQGRFHSIDEISEDCTQSNIVAWQHKGVDLGDNSNIYQSLRTGKESSTDVSVFGLMKYVDSTLNSKRVKLSAYFYFPDSTPHVSLFIRQLRQEDVNQSSDYLDNKSEKVSVCDPNLDCWFKKEVEVTLPNDLYLVSFGIAIGTKTSFYTDNISVEVFDDNRWIKIDSIGFETGNLNENNWGGLEVHHDLSVSQNKSFSGVSSLQAVYNPKLFEATPKIGEVIEADIGNNLTCRVPLVLCEKNGSTFPKSNSNDLQKLIENISKIESSSAFDLYQNLASIAIMWNVIQHFHPYRNSLNINWNDGLTKAIESAYDDHDLTDFRNTLNQMMEPLRDGHMSVAGGRQMQYFVPICVDWIENEVVITESKTLDLKRGDIVKKINGILAVDQLELIESTISGSLRLKRSRALNIFGGTWRKEAIEIVIEREGKLLDFQIETQKMRNNIFHNTISDFRNLNKSIVEIDEEIFYTNVGRCRHQEFVHALNKLSSAKVVIFDCRWGAVDLSLIQIIPHLIDSPVTSPWWEIPQIVYPDQKNIQFSKSNWEISPHDPKFSGKIILLTSPRNISSFETAIGIIDYYNLATMVGDTTAGCNGNVNVINLPCGFAVTWTGMKVNKIDGTTLYTVGYSPDYPVKETILGVRKGKDEVLLFAIELARQFVNNINVDN